MKFACRFALLAVASCAIVALALLAMDRGGTFRFGLLRVTVNDFTKPLAVALLVAIWILVQEWRRLVYRSIVLGLLALVIFLGIVDFARQSPPIITDSDFAIIELYTELAARGRLLLGPYSRFGWHHPGPMYFYLQSVPYAASGHRAATLYGMAVGINLAATATLVWVVARANRGPLPLFVALACGAFGSRAPRLLASPWTAHVPVLPALTFIVLCAAVVSGRWRLLPLAVVFGSFIAQTHVAFVPMVCVLGVAVIAVALREEPQPRFILNASAWVGLVLWLLPTSEAISTGGGNAAALFRFFVTGGGSGHSLFAAVTYWSYGLCGAVRPDFGLSWGGHFIMQHAAWVVACALGQHLLLLMITVQAFRNGRRFETALASSAIITSIVGLWAITRIQGDVLDHEIFWLAGLGALNLAIIAAAGLEKLWGTRPTHVDVRGTTTALCVLVLVLVLCLGVIHLRDLTTFERRRTDRVRIPATYEAIRDYVRRQAVRKPLMEVEGDVWGEAAGVLLRLLWDGTPPVAVTGSSIPVFTNFFEQKGDEDALVTMSAREGRHDELRSRPGDVVVRDTGRPYVNAVRLTPMRQ